ncbi:MAG: hypothetical protein ACT4PL_04375 [Phycisphaerales bacterium]
MRLIINLLCLACVLALGVTLSITLGRTAHETLSGEAAREAVREVERVIRRKGTLGEADLNERGYPVTVDVRWFKDGAPMNPLVSGTHPWLEIAGESEAALQHPPVRLAVSESLATFWYNPYQGIVRARVPVMVSDAQSTMLYNRVNSSALAGILDYEHAHDEVFKAPDPARPSRTRIVEARAPMGE